jgi:hypothetical protein
MFSSSTISNINSAMIDGATQYISEYKSIFLMVAGLALALAVMDHFLDVMVERKKSEAEAWEEYNRKNGV